MAANFKKIVMPGFMLIDDRKAKVFITITYCDDRLSIVGDIGPLRNGDALGSVGQIYDSIVVDEMTFVDDWTKDMLNDLLSVWRRWHLNDMRAGTWLQQQVLDAYFKDRERVADWYKEAVTYLHSVGLLEHLDYKFGSSWLFEPVPPYVIDFLRNLPDSKYKHFWDFR